MDFFSEMDSLCCKFCGNVYKDPVLLDCSHSICMPCAQQFLSFKKLVKKQSGSSPKVARERSSSVAAVQDRSDTREKRSTSITSEMEFYSLSCPTCGQNTQVPADLGVKALKTNFDLRDVVEKFQRARGQQDEGTQCSDECGRKATTDCLTCELPFCEECFQSVHSRPALKKHTKAELGELELNKKRYCPKHNEELKLYCKACSQYCCILCSTFSEHKGHDVALINEIAESARQNVAQASKRLNEINHSITEAITGIESAMAEIHKVHDSFEEQLSVAFKEIRQRCDERQQQLLEESQKLKASKLSAIESQLSVLKSTSEQISTAVQSQKRISSLSNPYMIIKTQQTLPPLLKQLDDQEVSFAPVESPKIQINLDNKILLDIISSFGQVTLKGVPEQLPAPIVTMDKSQVRVVWGELQDGNDAITHYILEMSKDGAPYVQVYSGADAEYVSQLFLKGTYQYRVKCVNGAGASPPSAPSKIVKDSSNVPNTALINKVKVYSESGHYQGYIPENTLDMSISFWASPTFFEMKVKSPPECWISYDLGKPYSVTEIRLLHRGDDQAPKSLKLQKSDDPASGNWEDVHSFRTGKLTTEQSITGFLATSRYWRLVMLDNYGERNRCIYVLNGIQFFGFNPKYLDSLM